MTDRRKLIAEARAEALEPDDPDHPLAPVWRACLRWDADYQAQVDRTKR